MKKLVVALVAVFMMAGCLDVSSDGNGSGNDYSHDHNNDNSVHEGTEGTTKPDPDTYDEGLSQEECNDLGFFYCTIENKCLNQDNSGGTCKAK